MAEETIVDEGLPQTTPSSPLPGHLQDLTDRARGYVEAASSANTRKAYASDWKHFSAWCRRSNLSPLPSPPLTSADRRPLHHRFALPVPLNAGAKANSVSTIERRLSSLSWNYAQRGLSLDRKDRHIATGHRKVNRRLMKMCVHGPYQKLLVIRFIVATAFPLRSLRTRYGSTFAFRS
ncbi:hypothetical protein HNR29_007310, partial [Rhizobium leguminosarum]|nr:hypothetical protein [Rhizobium leguminosarum]